MLPYAPPRKVVVGTCIYPMYQSQNPWPGLDGRLDQLASLVEGMATRAEIISTAGLDLAVLPEVAVNGGLEGDAASVAFAFDGTVHERMAHVARRHSCYVVVPMFLAEGDGAYSNQPCTMVLSSATRTVPASTTDKRRTTVCSGPTIRRSPLAA